MSAVHRIMKAILPARTYAALQAESQTWKMTCPRCGHEYSVWDAGGIRTRAAGRPTRYAACPACGRRAWTSIKRDPAN
jgi:transposase-like protein